ncbi:hypothetical protein ACP275_01G118200 [Erythranthe tilingii]
MSFWSVEVKEGVPEYYSCIPGDGKTGLQLTQATLGKGSSKDNSYVECNVDGSKTPICICSLIPNKTETQTHSEPPGFNIEFTDESSEDSMRKKRENEENKYDVNDSFIDDKSISDDTFFGRLRPSSGKKEKVLKKKTNEEEERVCCF